MPDWVLLFESHDDVGKILLQAGQGTSS